MLTKKMEDALNKQMNEEFFSAHLYLAMSAHFVAENFDGFANWMYVQYQEEISHAQKFFNYINERGGKVSLDAMEKPKSEWNSILDVFEDTLEHEQHITKCINDLTDIAISEKDHATSNFLQWYIAEQVEEEANVSSILGQLNLIKDHPHALYSLNKEMGARVFVDATKE